MLKQAFSQMGRRLLAAGLLGGALISLASCAYWDLWDGDPAVSLPDSGKWVVLPMRAFVSRNDINVEGMQLCTVRQCGYDAAIERFTVTGSDAAVWEKSLSNPHQLAALIGKPYPKSTMPAPKVSVEAFSSGKWTGVQLAMSGGKKAHHLSGYVVGDRNEKGTTFIVVIAGDAEVARQLVLQSTQ